MSFLITDHGQFSPINLNTPKFTAGTLAITPASKVDQLPEFGQILARVDPGSHSPPLKKVMLYQKSNQEYQHQKKRAYAKDIMSFPVRMISHDRTALEAKELLSKHGFRHLPVVNEQHIIVGLISDREVSASLLGKSCAEIMLSKVIVAEENASLNEIAILFLREKINVLPIINHQRLLVGIITQTDILRYVVETTSLFGHA